MEFHRQTNKLNNYLFLINLICEFVCGFFGHRNKEEEKHRLVYRVAAQLKKMGWNVKAKIYFPANNLVF